MGRVFFVVFSTSLASALVGAWRAFSAWSSGNWSAFGDGSLFWLTWSKDPGLKRLAIAAAVAGCVLLVDFLLQHIDKKVARYLQKTLSFFSRGSIAAIALLLALLPHLIAPLVQADAQGKPNVIVVLLDTVRADMTGWGGYEFDTTPRLDALVANGSAFQQTVAQSSWTKPSTATLLTGRTPSHHLAVGRPAVQYFPVLENRERVLAEAFASAGYNTCAVSTNPNINSTFGFQQGFYRFMENSLWTADEAIAEASNWLDGQVSAEEPYLLYLHLNDAHYPYKPIPPFRGMFNKTGVEANLDGKSEAEFRLGEREYTFEQAESLRLSFAEEIRYLDDRVGAFLEPFLAEESNTLVVLCADHGEEFLEHGDLGHGHSLYDELILVPLMFAWSPDLENKLGFKQGNHSQQVRLMDVFPTLLDIAGLSVPEAAPALDGISLLPFLQGKGGPSRAAFAETDHPGSPLSGPTGSLRAWRTDDWKYIETDRWSKQAGRLWLFDLNKDGLERHNIAGLPDFMSRVAQFQTEMFESGWLIEKRQAPSSQTMLHNSMSGVMNEMGYAHDVVPEEGADVFFAPGAIPWVE